MIDPIRIQFNRGPHLFRTKICLFTQNKHSGEYAVATGITMTELKNGAMIPPESEHQIDDESIQEMLDNIWAMGFRPTGVKTGDETIEALRNHVGDLNSSGKRKDDLLDRMFGVVEKATMKDPVIIQHPERIIE